MFYEMVIFFYKRHNPLANPVFCGCSAVHAIILLIVTNIRYYFNVKPPLFLAPFSYTQNFVYR